jgi:hypothetical protein
MHLSMRLPTLVLYSADTSQSSQAQRYANLHALKRPEDEASAARRQSLHDSYGKVGVIGSMWNK